jgi:hypothetical protein
MLNEWVIHYNRGRPHASLGPAIPELPRNEDKLALNGHRVSEGQRAVAVPILAGLHHEYRLAKPPERNGSQHLADNNLACRWITRKR